MLKLQEIQKLVIKYFVMFMIMLIKNSCGYPKTFLHLILPQSSHYVHMLMMFSFLHTE